MKLILARGSSHHHNFLYGVPGQGSTLKEERMVDRTANFVEGLGSRIVKKTSILIAIATQRSKKEGFC